MKKIIFTVLILLFPIMVNATCDKHEISRLKALASQINMTYDYVEKDGKVTFSVTLHNVNKALKIVDNRTRKEYNSDQEFYEVTLEGFIYGGTYSFNVLSNQKDCLNKSLFIKYYEIPYYNRFYNDPLCVLNSSKQICQKWVDTSTLSYNDFKKALTNDKQEQKEQQEESDYNKIMDFFGKYYYIFLTGIILIALITIFIINKRNSYNFDI
ncbi:MAG: hypothetical protein NC181_00395 [Clostridium sp.]|nr:hypothetical protein [Clostridium sp.]MCM1443876.1 hypothetical protein [Candidatus Amulumruptor caecigallinarius]